MAIKDYKLSEDLVKKYINEGRILINISINNESIGIYLKESMDQYLLNATDYNNFKIKLISETEYSSIFEHNLYKEESLQTKNSEEQFSIDNKNTNFYYLRHGQKSEPLTYDGLKEKIDKKELLLTHLITWNDCLQWYKIFQIRDFNGPSDLPPELLPEQPSSDSLDTKEVDKKELINEKKNDPDLTSEAIVSLAFLGSKSKKEIEKQQVSKVVASENNNNIQDNAEEINELYGKQKNTFMIAIASILIVAVAGIIYSTYGNQKLFQENQSTSNKQKDEVYELTPTESSKTKLSANSNKNKKIGKSSRNRSRRTALKRPRKRKSFRKSRIYEQKKRMEDKPLKDSDPQDSAEAEELEPEKELTDNEPDIDDEDNYPDTPRKNSRKRLKQKIEEELEKDFDDEDIATNEEGPASESELFDEEESY